MQDKGRPGTQLSVEHVLPQKIEQRSEWAGLFTGEEHRRWLHRLANLALLSGRRNAAAGAASFKEKKKRYQVRLFVKTHYICLLRSNTTAIAKPTG